MITARELAALKPGTWLSDGNVRGAGTLLFRSTTTGTVAAYFRYGVVGKRQTVPLGRYSEAGKNGITLAEARVKAGEFSKLVQEGIVDLKRYLAEKLAEVEAAKEAEHAAKLEALEAQKRAQEAARKAAEDQAKYSLGMMLDIYVRHLEKQGKASAKDVQSVFRVHVSDELKSTPAREVTKAQLVVAIRKVSESGKIRTAGVLRSYLIAAYNLAVGAQDDVSAPSDLIPFRIDINPARDIKSIAINKGSRHLRVPELKRYLEALTQGANLVDQALLLALLAGGQRMEQLLRVRVSDYDDTTCILTLWDPKGRRADPRAHLVPLGPRAVALVETLIDKVLKKVGSAMPDPFLFTSIGTTVLNATTTTHRVHDISQGLSGAPFTMRDIRRTVETQLASIGIPKDIRAQILSHGLSGVQNQHYDRHDYQKEKQEALEFWEKHLATVERGEAVQARRKILAR